MAVKLVDQEVAVVELVALKLLEVQAQEVKMDLNSKVVTVTLLELKTHTMKTVVVEEPVTSVVKVVNKTLEEAVVAQVTVMPLSTNVLSGKVLMVQTAMLIHQRQVIQTTYQVLV